MTADARAEHLRVVAHEMGGHALTARTLGYKVRTITTRQTRAGAWTLGWTDTGPNPRPGFQGSVDRITILAAGKVAEGILCAQLPDGYWQDVDDDELLVDEALTAALSEMADQTEAQIVYFIQTDSSRRLTDQEMAEREASAAAGAERDWLLGLCSARARRIVAQNAALAVALIPDIPPFMTGDQLEALIASFARGQMTEGRTLRARGYFPTGGNREANAARLSRP